MACFELHCQTLCDPSSPNTSHVVINGGKVFEAYLSGMSSYSANRLWRTVRGRQDDDGDPEQISLAEQEQFEEWELNNFAGFFIHTATHVSVKYTSQQMSTTLFARYHGLSGYGQEVLASFGYLMPCTSYKRKLIVLLEDEKERTR